MNFAAVMVIISREGLLKGDDGVRVFCEIPLQGSLLHQLGSLAQTDAFQG